jgi:hypothetical protein
MKNNKIEEYALKMISLIIFFTSFIIHITILYNYYFKQIEPSNYDIYAALTTLIVCILISPKYLG